MNAAEKEKTGPAVFRAGCARVCITPELPCEMAGYFHPRVAERVERDLYASVLALENGGTPLVIVSTDLISMTDDLCMPAFRQAAEAYGLPLSCFVACASHTHTGPEIREGGANTVCADYVVRTAERIAGAVMEALGNRFDAVLCPGRTEAPGLAHNRLSRCADGTEVFGPQKGTGARVIGPAGPEDASVQTLAVYDTEKKLRAVAVNFACHPDLSGGGGATAIDADWPGEMCAHLAAVHGPEVVCLFWQGTAGDINHRNHRAKEPPWMPGGKSAVGRGVAGAALYAMETAVPMRDATLDGRRCEMEVPFYTRDERLFTLVEKLKAKGEAATYFEKNQVKRVEAWENDGKSDRFGITCLRIGDVAVVAMPGEIFTGWGLEIKRYSPARQTLVVELASSHGRVGYKATVDQCVRGARCKGAYGALPCLSQRHGIEAGQCMAEAAIEMLYELWPEAPGRGNAP